MCLYGCVCVLQKLLDSKIQVSLFYQTEISAMLRTNTLKRGHKVREQGLYARVTGLILNIRMKKETKGNKEQK